MSLYKWRCRSSFEISQEHWVDSLNRLSWSPEVSLHLLQAFLSVLGWILWSVIIILLNLRDEMLKDTTMDGNLGSGAR